MATDAGHDIVVLGGSAGGLRALRTLLSELSDKIQAAFFVVLHNSPHYRSRLPEVLSGASMLPAVHPVDKTPIQLGRIYIAPPDRHLLLEADGIRLTRGPKENRFRPAIDPLFRSAAYAFGPRVIGIVLSGALDDGTAGLWAIKDQGSIAIVQDPNEAEHSSMPASAVDNVSVDYCLRISEISELLPSLISQTTSKESQSSRSDQLGIETAVALGEIPLEADILKLGIPSIFTCPECHGALVRMTNGKFDRFRCHTGHAFSTQSLLAAISEAADDALWNALRAIEEKIMLLTHIAEHANQAGDHDLARTAMRQIAEARKQGDSLRTVVLASGTGLLHQGARG